MNSGQTPLKWAQPLAQDYTVVYKTPSIDIRTDAPALAKLPGGKLICAFVLVDRTKDGNAGPKRELKTLVFGSSDSGMSWQQAAEIEVDDGTLFVHEDKLYYLCNLVDRRNIVITCSNDEGASWSPPVTLFEGRFWNTSTGLVKTEDRLYWACGQSNEQSNFNKHRSRIVVVAGDLSTDLMDPAAWRISNSLTYPGTPAGLARRMFPYNSTPDDGDHWLEPNMIRVKGRLRVVVRLRIDGYATSGLAGICDLRDDGGKPALNFTQFYPIPGAQNHFHIVYDDVGRLFWMISNIPTNTQDEVFGSKLKARGFKGTPGNERRFLMLSYSADALNWFQAGCVAMWPSPMRGFNYTTPLIDGDDLLVASRTSKNGANQHDNDLITLHRLREFRALALNLFPVY
jgi:hypothetical protein